MLSVPLSAFEEYMFRDDRPEYPMTMATTLFFRGKVDVGLLSQAFDETIASEPLYRSIVCKKKRRWYWIPSQNVPVLQQCEALQQPRGDSGIDPLVSFNLRHSPGVLCEYRAIPNGFVIRLHVHHAICDGLATMRFIGNWFARYGELIGDTENLSSCFSDPNLLLQRENLQIILPHPLSRRTIAQSFYREVSHWLLRYPCRLKSLSNPISAINSPDSFSEVAKKGTSLFWTRLPEEFFDAYRCAAKKRAVSINTLFLGDYFQVLRQWLETTAGKQFDKKWIRVLMPTNLRKSCHNGIPAANMLGYVFLDRQMKDCSQPESLYTGIQNDVEMVKTWSMGAMFLSGVKMARQIPGGLTWTTSKYFCHATSIFSNIGCPCKILSQKRFHLAGTIRVGDAELVQLTGGPPVRPHSPLSGGLLLQGRFWTLSVVADLNRFPVADVIHFRNLLIDRFNQTAQS
ncbi:MAG: hypothetical protein LBQ50_06255 [Planctomycetaceae bacterium]|jgi:NRPS condensation-like uncharacterized protein|nr:hypothetical protein [Planctomycetaceae bacterium]